MPLLLPGGKTLYAGSQKLVQAMEWGFTAEEIEKICYKNALRVFRDVIGE